MRNEHTENLEESLGYQVNRVSRAFTYCMNNRFALAGYDVTVEQWRILVRLWHEDGQCQKTLAAAVCKDKTSLTRLIDGLEKRSLIVRVPDQVDRRHKLIYLTTRGKELRSRLLELAQTAMHHAERGIDEQDILTCKRVLTLIYDNIHGT